MILWIERESRMFRDEFTKEEWEDKALYILPRVAGRETYQIDNLSKSAMRLLANITPPP